MCIYKYFFFQHASNLEQKQNDAENKKVHGDVVKYGSIIQVGATMWFLKTDKIQQGCYFITQ